MQRAPHVPALAVDMHVRKSCQGVANGLGHGREAHRQDHLGLERFRERTVHEKTLSTMHRQGAVHAASTFGQAWQVGVAFLVAAVGQSWIGAGHDKGFAAGQSMLEGLRQSLHHARCRRPQCVIQLRSGGHRSQIVKRLWKRHVQVNTPWCAARSSVHGLVQGGARFGPQGVFSARGGIQLV